MNVKRVCVCVSVSASVSVCVRACANRQLERRASGALPPGLGPDQSGVCQFAGTQTASLYTHCTEQRGGERGRETPTQRGRRRFGVELQRSESIILS